MHFLGSIKSLRDVKYEDLLRRPPVTLDTAEISRYYTIPFPAKQ